ncbi:VacJ family lipoprotein [Novosphingobium piscinae]|uniref:VacJ family lipoprotein n=1 Tax=Novosphingobium piscinae TaxID=1507448 RepID=A0A7X1G0F3_9SPHN|nr:VacJ family lipoprotein [Novosphingobium piscinae]MBC2670343.1 VacJ family lipoprotein [Novosphingobium piscinae]
MPISVLVLLAAAQTPAESPPAPPPTVAIPPVTDQAPVAPVAVPEAAPPAPLSQPAADPAAEPAPRSELGNEIVVSARVKSPADPLVGLNAKSFEVVQAVDQVFTAPLAMGYKNSVPSPIRSGLRNFLRNLEEPVSALNYVLQLKPGRAAKSTVRFVLNSTVGVVGLVDVAKRKPFHLPYRPNGFANTFACYGIGNGPFFFLPLVGPITLRDLVGLTLDKPLFTVVIGPPFSRPYYSIPAITIDALNDRIEQDAVLTQMREESGDPYVAVRELYLRQRRAEIAAICPKKGDQPIDPALPPRVGKGVD